MNINDKVSQSKCCGCGACVDSCPTKAIKLSIDPNSLQLVPIIDKSKCVNCGKCIRSCPAFNEKPANDFAPYGFACKANDEIRSKSSSGGLFALLAQYVLSNKGYVVGAVFDETDFSVVHVISNDANMIEKMKGSKYVQSDPSGVYSKTKSILEQGNLVLFTGTPCQCAGIKNFLGKDYDNLIVVDILCHGPASPELWRRYLEENFDISKITNIKFRNKEHRNGTPGSLTVEMKDGRVVYSEYFDNSIYKIFLHKAAQRESCFNCKFAEFPRPSDLTIGDFWGAKYVESKIDYEKGCSVCLVNSKKGKAICENIKNSFAAEEKYPIDKLLKANRNTAILRPHKRRNELIPLLQKHNSLRTATEYVINDKYDVGVFGTTMNPNFGGLITYYALYKVISNLGYSTIMINKPIFNNGVFDKTHATEFYEKHFNNTEHIKPSGLSVLNEKIDRFVLGSDQVWNYKLFHCWRNSLYLDFVNDKKIKISYAASFGHDYHAVAGDEAIQASKYLKRFDFVSVRENAGVNILKNYSVDGVQVLDPVFLLDKNEYVELSKYSELSKKHAFIGSYIIEPTDYKLSLIKKIKEKLNKENYNLTDGDPIAFNRKSKWFKDKKMHIQNNATIYDWLAMIINSDFVVTDSFHASSFCIIFNKPFILLQEKWALSRMETLMKTFELSERWINDFTANGLSIKDNWFEPLPDKTKDILESEKQRSLSWLKNALNSTKQVKKALKPNPLFNKSRIEDYFFFMLQNRKDYIMFLTSCGIDKELLSKIDFKCNLTYKDFNIDDSKCFLLIYDYDNDHLVVKNDDMIEYTYNDGNIKITSLLDNLNMKINEISVKNNKTTITEFNPSEKINIAIYSKSAGEIIDNFSIVSENGTAVIKRV